MIGHGEDGVTFLTILASALIHGHLSIGSGRMRMEVRFVPVSGTLERIDDFQSVSPVFLLTESRQLT